jgi:cation transport ATPase
LDKVSLLLKKEVTLSERQESPIDQSEIVVDDLIRIERGDQVVVDGKIVRPAALKLMKACLQVNHPSQK